MALVIGVAAMTAVGGFTDRIRLVLTQEASELLASDLALSSKKEIDSAWKLQAEASGLKTARFTELRSVIVAHDQPQLVEAKAVDSSYPLRGELRISMQPDSAIVVAQSGPRPGEAWPDVMLAGRLNLKPGDTVQFGTINLLVSAILQYEPDRAGSVFNIAPRLLINHDDLSRSGLLGPASLKEENLLLAGSRADIEQYRQWLESRIGPADTLLTGRNARPELNSALQRAEQFLGLAALVAVLLAGVAIAMAAHRHARRHFDAVAVMRCMGASSHDVLTLFSTELLILGTVASAFGCALGYLAQEVLAQLLHGLFSQTLPLPTLRPILFGFSIGLILLLGFALPPVASLRKVPPLRVLRRDLAPDIAGRGAKVFAISVALLLCAWQAGEVVLATMVIAGAVSTVLLLAASASLLVRLLASFRKGSAVSWRYGISNLHRRSGSTVIQVVAFGLGIMAMLLLTLVRTDLVENWQRQLPPDAPNTFLVNVQQDQVEPIRSFLSRAGVGTPLFHPMVKGRLLAINERKVTPEDYQQERARRLVEREFNLSWTPTLDADNHVVKGSWWDGPDKPAMQWSVEEQLANTLGINFGDRIVFDVAGQLYNAEVSSLRKVSWDSFRVNFFVTSPPGYLPKEQASYITAFHLPHQLHRSSGELLQQFPTITLINVEEVMQRVRGVISRVAMAVEFVFLFTLLAGFTVLFAAMQSSQDERMREVAILRTLGAGNATVRSALLTEFGTMGVLSGLLAALAATVVAWVLTIEVFQLEWVFNTTIWWAGLLAGGIIIPLAGLISARQVLNTPPLLVLRRHEG
ncbi:MAG: FtsX-like permease family protein [Mariprofundaceae bacterium]|nr:FtsX-like permease family protein [Mariprofundaceae bacterium]